MQPRPNIDEVVFTTVRSLSTVKWAYRSTVCDAVLNDLRNRGYQATDRNNKVLESETTYIDVIVNRVINALKSL